MIRKQQLTTDFDVKYVNRPPVEQNCYKAIQKQGGLIRIKAPQKMGKTLLLGEVLYHAKEILGYHTVKIDFNLCVSFLEDYNCFLKSFSYQVSSDLKIDDIQHKIEEEWESPVTPSMKCTNYFNKYILSTINTNLVLGLDHFEVLFKKKELFENFCCLLRAWHESTEPADENSQLWRKLRLLIVNSTEDYPGLDDNHSPFNVGTGVDERTGLEGFTISQVTELLTHYTLTQTVGTTDLQKLVELVGGHPYLIQQSFCYLEMNPKNNIQELLKKAATEEGIFSHYLREISQTLNKNNQLKDAYNQVIKETSVILEQTLAFRLHSLGLIKFDNNYSVSSCDLYRQYFLVHNFIQEINQMLQELYDQHPNISETEARSIVEAEFTEKITIIRNREPQNWSILKQQLLDPERWFQGGKAALIAIAEYYISNSVIYQAGLAFLDEFSSD